MIEVGGKQFRTIEDKFYVNGKQVLAAYANRRLVYPEKGDSFIIRIAGRANFSSNHSHSGSYCDESTLENTTYTMKSEGGYSAELKSSIVIRLVAEYGQVLSRFYVYDTDDIPGTISPDGWIMYDKSYAFGHSGSGEWSYVNPISESIHPLVNAGSMPTNRLQKDGGGYWPTVEMAVSINISDLKACSWTADKINSLRDTNGVLHKNLTDIVATAVPIDISEINGIHVFSGGLTSNFLISGSTIGCFCYFPGMSTGGSVAKNDYVRLSARTVSSFATHNVRAMQNGKEIKFQYHNLDDFIVGYIPHSTVEYSGWEDSAPEEYLHPSF